MIDFNIKTTCAVCGTPLNGCDLYYRNGYYYCASDYERTSPEELAQNEKVKRDNELYLRIIRSSQ